MNEYAQVHDLGEFSERIRQAEQGKEIFKNMFEISELDVKDAFLEVLTKSEECIRYGTEYLPDFINFYHKRNVYVLMDNDKYKELFATAGGTVKICSEKELECLAVYFSVFHKKELPDTRFVFLCEKDGYGLYVEDLLEKKEFSLEEYVAICLFQLKNIKKKA